MKIIIIRPTPSLLDLKTYNLQEIGLAKALVRKGHICDVMYYSNQKDTIEKILFDNGKEINVLWLRGYDFFHEGIYPTLRKYLNDYDVIQVGGYVGLLSCWLDRTYRGKVIHYQGPYYNKNNKGDNIRAFFFDKLILPFCYKRSMRVMTKSLLATNYIKQKGIVNVQTIGVGLDVDNLITKESETNAFIDNLKKTKRNYKYLLYVGVIEPRRNTSFLLNVFDKIRKERNDCKLIIVGRSKGEYGEKCVESILGRQSDENIIYIEKIEQKHMKSLYEIVDVFLLPTSYEIFGMVMLEAMYFGVPVITTYNGGSSVLIDEDNGIIIDNLDEEKWCNEICNLMDDKFRYDRVSKNAKVKIRKEFTWDALVDKIIGVYGRVE